MINPYSLAKGDFRKLIDSKVVLRIGIEVLIGMLLGVFFGFLGVLVACKHKTRTTMISCIAIVIIRTSLLSVCMAKELKHPESNRNSATVLTL